TVLALAPDHRQLAAGRMDGTVQFHPLSPPGWDAARTARPGPKEFDGFWRALAGSDAARAYEAIWGLTAAGPDALAFLRPQLKPAAPRDQERVRKLMSDLDSPQFAVREAASKELASLGADLESDLRQALDAKPP